MLFKGIQQAKEVDFATISHSILNKLSNKDIYKFCTNNFFGTNNKKQKTATFQTAQYDESSFPAEDRKATNEGEVSLENVFSTVE